ncbi:two component transcriptional regulator, LuxR family [Filimonas lacunae]|uniref:Two component transcriptional regulator, LuxR family n=1 Tax=Filimonas lacunae TaxID=477680 RepID=A0A173MQU8_9BACT|nr:response regulator transcription factor [Filimonas lacunae]BAV10032.1 response regulator [Filimonas lacunae]SIS82892.1 two component transcriptional regulator, LuxR family [Filimonas lacunae]
MRSIKIIIFEDNPLMQQSLSDLLQLQPDFEVAGVYSNAKHICRLYAQHQPDIILSDIDMPEVNGLEGISQLKKEYPEAKTLILTVFDTNDNILNAICLGADGYLLKSTPPEKIIESIKDVIEGGCPLTPSVAKKILTHFPKTRFVAPKQEESLSEKEKEVLEYMVKGYSYKMIANSLNKSVETIRVQIKSIYRKLHVNSNAEAIIKAMNGYGK